MCDALRELMKPEMEEELGKAVDKKARDVAERMIRKDKYSDAEIADISGLTVKQVQKIKSDILTTA